MGGHQHEAVVAAGLEEFQVLDIALERPIDRPEAGQVDR
jgi:hypothetical protein